MSPERQIYLLDPQELPPETIAVAFAKTSRSPQSFREIAAELTDEKSAEFHEKWVVGYGHASVAEHAVLHLAVENISRLAVECLESNRLASYTEKSTRYQKWGEDDFFIPDEIRGSLFLDDYLQTIHRLINLYKQSLPVVREVISLDHPRNPGETEAAWERRIRSDYVDVCRYLLPAACLANVGVTINARALEHAITKMLSHPLQEVRQIGQEIKIVAQAAVPTLVKYAEPSAYLTQSRLDLSTWMMHHTNKSTNLDWCTLLWMDPEIENRLLSALVYPQSNLSYTQLFDIVSSLTVEEKSSLARSALGSLGKFDIPLREMEHSAFTFEVILDQGAYFELKRHRMMTQSVQLFSPDLGYALPSAFTRAGLESEVCSALDAAAAMYHQLTSISPHVAAYVLPNAFNRRVLLTLNLRSAMHLIKLRSAPNAHFAMRRVANRLAAEMKSRIPLLAKYMDASTVETWPEIENLFFTQTA